MFDRMNAEEFFLESLPKIESIAASVCRIYSVWGDDADDFVSWVKERLIENDYAVLRKYRGEAELNTFLTVIVTRLFHAHARERMGRWRNSAVAERLGQLAKDLEVLVYRDGCSLGEAGERLRSAGRTDQSDAELARLLARLPVRKPLRRVDLLEEAVEASRGDERVAAAERHRYAVMAALFQAMGKLQPEERAIVRMHLADGRSVADVARALGLGRQGLYRRVNRLRERLRRSLEAEGVSRAEVVTLLEAERQPLVMTWSEATHGLGPMLDTVAREGSVFITNEDTAQAVVMSIDRYEALVGTEASAPMSGTSDFADLLIGTQTPEAEARLREAFGASPEELGRAAVAAARREG